MQSDPVVSTEMRDVILESTSDYDEEIVSKPAGQFQSDSHNSQILGKIMSGEVSLNRQVEHLNLGSGNLVDEAVKYIKQEELEIEFRDNTSQCHFGDDLLSSCGLRAPVESQAGKYSHVLEPVPFTFSNKTEHIKILFLFIYSRKNDP
ncbi:hypothetical protein QAD02_017972 [Eretmocerus hayati]|uniref:Uncharacterized protein n=1 Tax=Eretmocerus hayati TaxID=131215 RepID=A0ACC2PF27_9HYME|nr:hypothetical protein QAD02_017972 [Eretmocerus hayati]